MKSTVLFVILEPYAEWEPALLATALTDGFKGMSTGYEVKTVSITKGPVKSIGGFTVLPDYSLNDIPNDYAGVIVVGGYSWRTEVAKNVAPLAKKALSDGKLLGAICDATVFLGMNGLLNTKRHTSNSLEELTKVADENYTNSNSYVQEQAVRDGNLITANGTGYAEFAREVLYALNAFPAHTIEEFYNLYKFGAIEMSRRE